MSEFYNGICDFCKEPIGDRIHFTNHIDKMINRDLSWIYMPLGGRCHFECYLEECFKKWKEKQK